MTDFSSFSTVPYIGTLVPLPINILDPDAIKPRLARAVIPWILYPEGGVSVSLLGSGASQLLGTVKTVRIDNTGNTFPVTVFFPDTGDAFTVSGFQSATRVVLTNLTEARIFCASTTGQTEVFFLNRLLYPDAINQQGATVIPLFGTTTNSAPDAFIPQALGDQHQQANVLFVNYPNNRIQLFGGPRPSGTIYLRAISAWVSLLSWSGNTNCQIIVERGIASGDNLYNWGFSASSGGVTVQTGRIEVFTQTNFQLALDATKDYGVYSTQLVVLSGVCEVFAEYTYQPV